MERLVEVWMHPRMLERLKGGIPCSRLQAVERPDGTYSLNLNVSTVEARCWDFPVELLGDGEALVRDA